MNYSPFSFTLLFFFLFSCNSGSKNSLNEKLSFKSLVSFQKLDSIHIEYLGNPTVHDLDPASRTVIFMEHKQSSEEIFIANFNGNILASFSKFGDMPDSYGKQLGTIRILDNNSFLVYGYNGFLTYNFNGNIQSLVKYNDFIIPSQSFFAMGSGMEKHGKRFLYINQEQPPQDITSLEEFPLLIWLDPENGEKEPVINFPEGSMFISGKHFFMRSWFPVFTLNKDQIFIIFGSEPVIYVYETENPYSLISRIPLNLKNYTYFKGAENINDEKLFGMSMIGGRIDNIKKLDKFFIISYFPGYDALDTKNNFENNSPDEAMIFRERMLKKYPPRIAIIDSVGNVINDFVPEGLESSSMLLRNGELWIMEKPDEVVERNYFRLFRVELKLED